MTGERGRILELDDDADFADVFAAFLRGQGHRVAGPPDELPRGARHG
jgi:hypothetical protein